MCGREADFHLAGKLKALLERLELDLVARQWTSGSSPREHEVHRGRATFSTTATAALLEELPELKLAASFSHWCCVHESFLEDQAERVGHPKGPQVNDPRAPEWQELGPSEYMPTLPYTRQPVAELWEINISMKEPLQRRLH